MRCDATRCDATRSVALYRAPLVDSRSARRDRRVRSDLPSRRESPSRARVDARHRVTTRSFARRSTPSVESTSRRLEDVSRARAASPTDATRRRRARRRHGDARARASPARVDAAPGRPARVPSRRRSPGRRTLANVLNAQLERVMEATSACGRATTTTSDDDDARARRTSCGCC